LRPTDERLPYANPSAADKLAAKSPDDVDRVDGVRSVTIDGVFVHDSESHERFDLPPGN